MTMDIPIQSAAMLYVVHVRCSGPVGARSSLYRLDDMAPVLMRSNSARLFTARSRNSSCSMILPSSIQGFGLRVFRASGKSLEARCLSRPLHGLDREVVQRLDRELQFLFGRVLVFGVAEAAEALDEEHH